MRDIEMATFTDSAKNDRIIWRPSHRNGFGPDLSSDAICPTNCVMRGYYDARGPSTSANRRRNFSRQPCTTANSTFMAFWVVSDCLTAINSIPKLLQADQLVPNHLLLLRKSRRSYRSEPLMQASENLRSEMETSGKLERAIASLRPTVT